MQVRDGDDPEHVGLDLKYHTVGKSVDEATPRVLRHHHPRFWELDNTSDCRVDFLCEFNTKTRLAFLVIPRRLAEFFVRSRMKIESHR